MPSSTKKQAIAMAIAAKGKSNIGIPKSVGQEFHAADKRKSKSPFKLTGKGMRHGKSGCD